MKPKGTDQRIRNLLAEVRLYERERFDRAPLPYPTKFNTQIDQFIDAVEFAVLGDIRNARDLIESIDHKPMVQWFDETAQHVGSIRVAMLGGHPGKRSGGGKRDMRASRVRHITARDGYLCGYCDIRIVEPEILRKIDLMLGGGILQKRSVPRNNRSYHGIWLMAAATLDHIEPLSKNRDDSDENLVTCCWSCNFGKYHYELCELGLQAPTRERGQSTGWQGARDLLGRGPASSVDTQTRR